MNQAEFEALPVGTEIRMSFPRQVGFEIEPQVFMKTAHVFSTEADYEGGAVERTITGWSRPGVSFSDEFMLKGVLEGNAEVLPFNEPSDDTRIEPTTIKLDGNMEAVNKILE